METGRMDAYRVNPPLPRLIAVLPLQFNPPKNAWLFPQSPYERIEFSMVDQWITRNLDRVRRDLLMSRSMMLMFVALGAWVIDRWATRLYGPVAGAMAVSLWLLNPDVIANAATVAPDIPASATGLLACYLYWDWLTSCQRKIPWHVATAIGLAILCKFSWLFLLPLALIITVVHDSLTISDDESTNDSSINTQHWSDRLFVPIRRALGLLISFSLTTLLINACYGFDGSGKPLGDFGFISEALTGTPTEQGVGNRFQSTFLEQIPVPLPEQMVLGLDYLKYEFEIQLPSYLNGQWQRGGWWHFYLYALLIKMPLGYSVIILAVIGWTVFDWTVKRRSYCGEWMLLLLAVVFIGLVSSQTGFTHHVRYVLPAYGFLFIIAARVVVNQPRPAIYAFIAICMLGTISFHASHPGLAHTFFNPIARGPNNGWRHLGFSNVDWGQSTYRMANWAEEHSDQRPMTVMFRSNQGKPGQLVGDLDRVRSGNLLRVDSDAKPGPMRWYLLSSYQMTLAENWFFRSARPVDQPFPDILLFYLDENRVCAAMQQDRHLARSK